jgi:cell division protein FtsZ
VQGVEFICANTDAQALKRCLARPSSSSAITKGLGAGANPEVGRQAARRIASASPSCCEGADMVFITAGMGGGTGTGAAPVVAESPRKWAS